MDEQYDRKKVVAIKPDSVSLSAWLDHLRIIMPNRADALRREAMANPGKTPKVYQTFRDDVPVGYIIEWERDPT